jgi:hypothetical protein
VHPAARAAGARFELTFHLIDRTGQQVKPLDLQLLNIAAGTNIDLGQATSRQVRPGRYNVAAWIGTGSGPRSFTLDDQIVNVTRSRTITLDARQGRRVRVGLNATGAVQELLELAPIVHGDWAFNPSGIADSMGGGTSTVPAYVVPMAARSVTLYVYSVWEKQGNTAANPSPFRYDIIDVHRGGIPAHPNFPVRRSSLARVSIAVRATDQSQSATLSLSPMGRLGPPLPLNAGTTLGATPAHLVSYRSPGYQWQPIVDLTTLSGGEIRDDVLNMNPYGRGHFTERYFGAVLAPQPLQVSASVEGRRLGVGLFGSPFGDPLHPGSTDQGQGGTGLLRLFAGSQLLAKNHLDSFGGATLNARVPMATHRYSLQLDATRGPSATVSTQLHADWRFLAHGTTNFNIFTAQLYAAQLIPAGLDSRNRAAGGALTQVALRIFGYAPNGSFGTRQLGVVRAQASTDDGTTWHRVSVSRRGDHYVFSVRDPHQAGFVSLRVFVKDGAGNSELLTVIRAYGVR